MTDKATFGRVLLIILAVIGGLAVLAAVGMFGMHFTMMGNTNSGGMWHPMAGMCRGMMGS